MLCVNCDQPLPDGAAVCPTCGAPRLQLLVSPATEPSRKPRRRHRGLKTLGLLVGAVVLVALAGQAYQSYADAQSHAPEPRDAPKGKAAAKPPASTTPTAKPSASPTPTQAPPPAVQVDIGRVPRDVEDRDGVVDAVRAAMRDWAGQGVDLREAEDEDAADVAVRFILYAAEAEASNGVATVPLGDTACGGEWAPYTLESVRALAARALGEAMGRDGPSGPGQLMDPSLKPEHDGCVAAEGTLHIAGGRSDGKPFRLEATATVAYTMVVPAGYADVCLLTPAQWDAFAVGEGGGEACSFSTTEESESAVLAPGDYILGFRCVDANLSCRVDYTLSARAA